MVSYEKCDFGDGRERCDKNAAYNLFWLNLDEHGVEQSDESELHYLSCEQHLFDLAEPILVTLGLPDEVSEYGTNKLRPDVLEVLVKRLTQ